MEPQVSRASGAKSVAFVTIGCKLNQFETEQMREMVESEGHTACRPGETADVCVINTCTVTHKSDYRSRQAVRRAIRSNPDALVVVTGCYAQVAPGDLAGIDGVDLVLGNAEKGRLVDYIASAAPDCGAGANGPTVRVAPVEDLKRLTAGSRLHGFGRYTRAFVKIQDGCDNRCTYCAVPAARGRSRSKTPAEILAELQTLAGEGYREVVLTGVHLGSYGKDLKSARDGEGGPGLAELLRDIAAIDGLERIRLSSIEPTDFTDELLELMADPGMKIAPHVHIPLQSGDDGVLRRMARPYERGFYAALVERIAGRVSACGIGADVMVGFPGEDDAAFANTFDLVAGLPVTYLHVFSYSPRPGTPAAQMAHQVRPEVKKERSRLLRRLGKQKSLEFRQSLLGSRLRVIVLEAGTRGLPAGLSGNYVKAYFEHPVPVNRIVECEAVAIRRDGLRVDLKEQR